MDWRRISAAMAGEEPVFVVGVYRSGTSALRTTLHRVPAFHAPDARSPETRVFRHPDRIERIFERPQRRMLRYLRGDETVAQELVHTLGEVRPAFAPLRRWLHDRSRDRARRWRLLGHHHRLRVYFHYAQRARGSARILEKSPQHVAYMEEIFATFPRARVLMCIRHPVDVLSSLRKRLERERARGRREERLRWMEVSRDEFAAHYRETVAFILEQRERRPERSRLVRYEDVTADPPAALRALCEFVGEPFDAASLLGAVEESRDAHGSPVKGSRIAANVKRWRDWIAEPDARHIEDTLAGEIRALGYARYT